MCKILKKTPAKTILAIQYDIVSPYNLNLICNKKHHIVSVNTLKSLLFVGHLFQWIYFVS